MLDSQLLLTRRRPIKPNLTNFRAKRRIADDWRDVEPIQMAQILARPNSYRIPTEFQTEFLQHFGGLNIREIIINLLWA